MVLCVVCDEEIEKGVSVEEHTDKYHPLACAVCGMKFIDAADLEMHIQQYHPGVHGVIGD